MTATVIVAAGLAGGDGHVPRRGRVVAAGRGGAVRGGVVDRHRHVVGNREGHGEGRVHGAGVAFRDRHVVDGNPRLVVKDGADPLTVGDGRVGRGLRLTTKVSFGSARRSPLTSDGDGLAGLAGGEGQRAGRRPV